MNSWWYLSEEEREEKESPKAIPNLKALRVAALQTAIQLCEL